MSRLWLAIWLCCGGVLTVQAQPLADFKDLSVQWLQAEKWLWQGQSVVSQHFYSSLQVEALAQQIQQRIDSDLRIQRLASAWLLSFDRAATHYLILLSAQSKGSQGWFSSLSLHNTTTDPPPIFNGLYSHSWQLQSEQNHPTYLILEPKTPNQSTYVKLKNRLLQQGWKNTRTCQITQWCQWQKASQKMIWWLDQNSTRWHVLWWPAHLGE